MWQCTGWSECNDGVQKRTCIDLNKDSTLTNKPTETLFCEQKVSTEILKISSDNKQQQQGFNLSLILWILGAAVIVILILIIIMLVA